MKKHKVNTIYHDFTINVSKEKVFGAIATAEGLNNWWTLKCSGKFELAEVINLNFTDEYDWYAKISEINKNSSIEFLMIKASEDWMPTSFGFFLSEENPKSTTVQFYHKNWKEVCKEYRVASYCWAILLSQLKQYLESGITTPFEKRN